MASFVPPANISERVHGELELLKQYVREQFVDLDTNQEAHYWSELHQYAQAQTKHKGHRAPLVASHHVDAAVRRALELLDARIAEHTSDWRDQDRNQFWDVLHCWAERQAREAITGAPKPD